MRLVFTANALTPTGYSRFFTVGAGPRGAHCVPPGAGWSVPLAAICCAAGVLRFKTQRGNLVVSDSFSTLSATLAFAAASGGPFHDRSDLLIGTTTIRVSSGIAEFKDLGIADGATAGRFPPRGLARRHHLGAHGGVPRDYSCRDAAEHSDVVCALAPLLHWSASKRFVDGLCGAAPLGRRCSGVWAAVLVAAQAKNQGSRGRT